MTNSLHETNLQGIMAAVFIKTNIHTKMMNANTMIPLRRVSERDMAIYCPLL